MHLKVMRVFIDGILRFGIPACFYMGLVVPARNADKKLLQQMSDHLAEGEFKSMYGEKIENESDDYWPFVCVPITSPNFLHNAG